MERGDEGRKGGTTGEDSQSTNEDLEIYFRLIYIAAEGESCGFVELWLLYWSNCLFFILLNGFSLLTV